MGGWGVRGSGEMKLKLNSAKAEAKASSLGLAELGNFQEKWVGGVSAEKKGNNIGLKHLKSTKRHC